MTKVKCDVLYRNGPNVLVRIGKYFPVVHRKDILTMGENTFLSVIVLHQRCKGAPAEIALLGLIDTPTYSVRTLLVKENLLCEDENA